MMTKVFYDSYALIAFLRGDENYKKLFDNYSGVTAHIHLMEVYYAILKREGVQKADQILKYFSVLLVDSLVEDIPAAMKFRYKHKKLSYADALGYQMARRMNIPFVTGDKEFEGRSNTIFIKSSS